MFIPDDVNLILNELNNNGYNAYLVGGCVRDTIMGNIPNDYDITTSATPDEIQRVFQNRKTLDIGIKHGTITVFTDAGRQVEVTTYRTDGEYLDNRHPENVIFVNDIESDLSRRDFTVNALAYNPQTGLIDVFGGIDDITNKVIRSVGNPEIRFNEDALRILRGLRFASTLNFTIENDTSESIINNAHLLENVSVERILVELKKMITGENFANIAREFSCVLAVIMPELSYSNKDMNTSINRAVLCENDFISRFVVLFLNGNNNDAILAEKCLRHFNCDKKTITSIKNLIATLESYDDGEISIKRIINKLGYDDAERYFKICISLKNDGKSKNNLNEFYRIKNSDECVFIEDMAVSGKDLISIGFNPRKNMGKILNTLFEMVLNDEISNEKGSLLFAALELKKQT